jgi:hypothetical protein
VDRPVGGMSTSALLDSDDYVRLAGAATLMTTLP